LVFNSYLILQPFIMYKAARRRATAALHHLYSSIKNSNISSRTTSVCGDCLVKMSVRKF